MAHPAPDLRLTAKTKGNRPFIPPQYAAFLQLGYLVAALLGLAAAGFAGWRTYLQWEKESILTTVRQQEETLRTQEYMLWLSSWRGRNIPFQEMLVNFFKAIDPETRLSQLEFTLDPERERLNLRVAINSDRNTSARLFRGMTSFLQEEGMNILSLEQNQVVGATVFNAEFKIDYSMRRRAAQSAARRSAEAVEETNPPAASSSAESEAAEPAPDEPTLTPESSKTPQPSVP
jgi:hypothetical protein